MSITNLGSQIREIELTSYAEIVLAPHADDDAHPAFSKMFVETEFVATVGAILATRRRQSPGESQAWAAHFAVVDGDTIGDVQFETDRARFLGRGRGIGTPISMLSGSPLSNTTGVVLDPIFSVRRRIRVPPRTTARMAFWTLIAPSRKEVLDLVDKHRGAVAFDRATTLAGTQAQVQLDHLGIGTSEAHLFQRLGNPVLYADPMSRPASEILCRGGGQQSALWAHGISGDVPIILVRIDAASDLEVVRQLLLAHEYWRMKLLSVDLVILNERPQSDAQDLQVSLDALVRAAQFRQKPAGEGVRGAIFTLRADLVSVEVRNLLQTATRAVLVGHHGSLSEQVGRLPEPESSVPPPRCLSASSPSQADLPRPVLEFFNGFGGFADNGREYMVTLEEGQCTPAPCRSPAYRRHRRQRPGFSSRVRLSSIGVWPALKGLSLSLQMDTQSTGAGKSPLYA